MQIYIVAKESDAELEQDDFRWDMVHQLVATANRLDADRPRRTRGQARQAMQEDSEATNAAVARTREDTISRFNGGLTSHHLVTIDPYVSPEEARANQLLINVNPPRRQSKKKARQRDSKRTDGKVRNPMHTSNSPCIVCKYQFGILKWTCKYCKECTPDPKWPKTNRATGYQVDLHPRLCSRKCFEYFHTHQIVGLDYNRDTNRDRIPLVKDIITDRKRRRLESSEPDV